MNPTTDFNTARQLFWLFTLAIPIACIARTVVFEEILREPREWCANKSQLCASFFTRKFFYVFTCEYCFSHYVTLAMLAMTRYTLVFEDWRGYVIAGFSIVWIANLYMSLFGRLRLAITSERQDIEVVEKMVMKNEDEEQAK